MTNRAANQPIIIPPTSNLLFSSNFAGAPSFGAWAVEGVATRQISGVDSDTGFRWPTSGLGNAQAPGGSYGSSIILINNVASAATIVANPNAYGTVQIGSEIGPSGSTENYLELNLLDTAGAPFGGQLDLQIGRVSGGGYIPPDLDNLYLSYYFKFPSSLFSGFVAGNSLVLWDFKSGGYGGAFGGDFRLLQNLVKSSNGGMYSLVRADRSANGTMTNAPDGILPFVTTSGVFKYWDNVDTTTPVPADEWVKLEIYINRHAKKGIVLAAINSQIVCMHIGRTLGEFANVWGRLYPVLCYSSALQSSVKICQLRFHDYPPDGSALQVPAAQMLYKYAA